MESWMIIVLLGGKHVAHFFQYKENAILFLETITENYSAKLYGYNPYTDTWEATDGQDPDSGSCGQCQALKNKFYGRLSTWQN